MYVRLPPDDWIDPIVRPGFSEPLIHPGEGIASPESIVIIGVVIGEVGSVGAGAPLAAGAAEGGMLALPDDPALDAETSSMPPAPFALFAGVAVGGVTTGAPAAPPAPPDRLAGAVAPASGMAAGLNFVPAPLHAAHATASPSSEAKREWRCITLLLGNHASDRVIV